MSNIPQTFESPEIPQIEQILADAEEKARAVQEAVDRLDRARQAESETAQQYGQSMSDEDSKALEESATVRARAEAEVNALRNRFELERHDGNSELIRLAREEIIGSPGSVELFAAAFERKADTADKLVGPARDGVARRFGELFRHSTRYPQQVLETALRSTAEGQLHARINSLPEGLRSTARSLRQGTAKPSLAMLANLKSPLPRIEDFEDKGIDRT